MPLAHTALCITSHLFNTLDCSQPLYFSMHVKEKVSVSHTGVGAGRQAREASQTKNRETEDTFRKKWFHEAPPPVIALCLTALLLD